MLETHHVMAVIRFCVLTAKAILIPAKIHSIPPTAGVDLDIAVTDLKQANRSGYKWSSKPSVSIPYIGDMVVLKSDTSYWLSQGFKLTDFVKDFI
jgi:hypothetical protein